jgi:hypothetical protein
MGEMSSSHGRGWRTGIGATVAGPEVSAVRWTAVFQGARLVYRMHLFPVRRY